MKNEQLKIINNLKRMAQDYGVEENPLFQSVLDRYITQCKVLNDLEKEIEENDVIVSKEYVKGKKNKYSNPAIVQFNRTTDSANKTVSTLMKIINGFKSEAASNDEDPLADIINGDDDNE